MLRWMLRLIIVLWSGLILLIISTASFSILLTRDVFVYAAWVEDDNRATDVRLYDMQSAISVVLFRRIDLMGMDVSADGRFLLLEQRLRRGRELQVLHLESGTLHTIYVGDFHQARWSPDGQWIAYRLTGLFDNGIYRVAVTGGEQAHIAAPQNVFTLSADNEAVYYSGWGTNDSPGIISLDIASGEKTILLAEERLFITDMVTSGQQIAFIGNRAPHVFNIDEGSSSQIGVEVGVGSSLVWSQSGERLALVRGQSGMIPTNAPISSSIIVLNLEGEILAEFSPPNLLYNSRVGWVRMR